MKTGQSKLLAVLLGLTTSLSGPTIAEELSTPVITQDNQIHVMEIGGFHPAIVKRKFTVWFGTGDVAGKEATRTFQELLKNQQVELKTFFSKPVWITGYTHIYADKAESYDSGSLVLLDIQKDKLVWSGRHAPSNRFAVAARNPLNVDTSVIHNAAQIANTGAIGGYGIGILANIGVRLVSGIFSEKSELNKGNPAVTIENCGSDCLITHHEVVLTMRANGADPEETYTLVLDKIDNKVDSNNLLPLASKGLELLALKVKQATSNADQSAMPISAPDEKTVQ